MSTDREPLAPTLELVERYVVGDLPLAEAERVAAYLATHDSAAMVLEALRQSVDFARGSAGDAAKRWAQLMDRIRQRELEARNTVTFDLVTERREGEFKLLQTSSVPIHENAGRHWVGEKTWLGNRTLRMGFWAGAIAVLFGAVIVLAHRTPKDSSGTSGMYTTRQYQQGVVKFDDGTRVTLAPQTTLRVVHFGAGRTVTLERGEAYFEVAHAAETPFIVQSGAATTKVLGTAFLVRYNPHDPHVRVAVTDGKVRVTTSARNTSVTTLSAGQVGDVRDSTTIVSTADNLPPRTEWVPGRVMFHDTPLAIVLQTISRWYGYQFRYTDQTLGTRNVTMLVSTRSSAEALAAIERVVAVNLTVVGDTVTLVPLRSRSSHSAPRIRTYDVWTPTREVGR